MSIILYRGTYYNLSAIPVIRKGSRSIKYKDGTKRHVDGYILEGQRDHWCLQQFVFIPVGSDAYCAIFNYLCANLAKSTVTKSQLHPHLVEEEDLGTRTKATTVLQPHKNTLR